MTAPTLTLNAERHGFSAESAKSLADFKKQVGETAKAGRA
jgi:hypothetical protein